MSPGRDVPYRWVRRCASFAAQRSGEVGMSRPRSGYDEVAARSDTGAAERARAIRQVLSVAHDAEEAVRLLDMLGLDAGEARPETYNAAPPVM
jgi:hypothetical protein